MGPQHSPKPSNPEGASHAPRYQTFRGTAFPLCESGTEGLIWAMQPPESKGYEGLIILEKGDLVTILSPSGEKLFEGEIQPVYQPGGHALGYWIHWIQKGWEPDAWAQLFAPENNSAVVLRPQESRPDGS